MKRSIRFFFLISTLFLGLTFSVSANTLSVDLSSRHVTVGEPFTLTLTYSGNNPDRFGEPDLSSLYDNFDFTGKKQSFEAKEKGSAYRMEMKLTYTLVPKHKGTFNMPSFYAGNDEYTPQYEVFVGEYFQEGEQAPQDDGTDWPFVIGSVLFIAGGLLFLLSIGFVAFRLFEKSKKRK